MNLAKASELTNFIQNIPTFKKYGRVSRVVGLMIESQGPESSIGDVCLIHVNSALHGNTVIKAEVVGFKDEIVILMPFTHIREISIGCLVEGTGKPLEVKVGPSLIGSVLDSMGLPIDETPLPKGLVPVRTEQDPPNPLTRPTIRERIEVGVKAIDGMLTVGKGPISQGLIKIGVFFS